MWCAAAITPGDGSVARPLLDEGLDAGEQGASVRLGRHPALGVELVGEAGCQHLERGGGQARRLRRAAAVDRMCQVHQKLRGQGPDPGRCGMATALSCLSWLGGRGSSEHGNMKVSA